jgi:hypothetical protein
MNEEPQITPLLYYREYPLEHYLTLPEFIVDKLNLNRDILIDLPLVRNKHHIFLWMMKQNFTQEQLLHIGW